MLLTKENIAIIEGDTTICKWVEERGTLNWDEGGMRILREKLGDIPKGSVALDIGAFIGDTTYSLSQWYDVVFAYEPNPAAFECLEHNAADNVVCINAPVGCSSYDLRVNKYNQGATQVIPSDKGSECKGYLSLPSKRVHFIKIDVEGMEPAVLFACKEIIERYNPKILIEQRVCDGNVDLVEMFLSDRGYTWEVVSGDESVQYDLFCK